MSDSYSTMYSVLTSFIPQIMFLFLLMPLVLLSSATRLMRSPHK